MIPKNKPLCTKNFCPIFNKKCSVIISISSVIQNMVFTEVVKKMVKKL